MRSSAKQIGLSSNRQISEAPKAKQLDVIAGYEISTGMNRVCDRRLLAYSVQIFFPSTEKILEPVQVQEGWIYLSKLAFYRCILHNYQT